jgi:hypothetical protein
MGRKTNRTESTKKSEARLGVHAAVLALNQGFAQVADSLQKLEHLGLFEGSNRRTLVQGFHLAVDETLNWINFEVAEVLHDRARREWSRLGQLRQKWEDHHASDGSRVLTKHRSEPQESARPSASRRRG